MQKPAQAPNYLNDTLRDAFRYRQLVSELAEAAEDFRPGGRQEPANIEEALANMLPKLCEALNGEKAFMAEVKTSDTERHSWIEVTAAYPGKAPMHRRLPWTPIFQKLMDQHSLVAGRLVDHRPETIDGLELFGATSAVLVRLQVMDKTRFIGVCNRRKNYLGPFLAADRMILESLTDLFTFGIELGQRRRQELEQLQKTALSISAEQTLEELLPEIAQRAGHVFHAPVILMLWNDAHTQMVIRASSGLAKDYDNHAVPQERVEAGLARLGNELSLVTYNLHTAPYGDSQLIEAEGLCSALSARLQAGRNLEGILNIYSRDPTRMFDQHDVELAEIFASQAAVAIRNASLRKRVAEDGAKSANLVRNAVNLESLADFLIDEVSEVLHAQSAGLALWKEENRPVTFARVRGLSKAFQRGWKISQDEVRRWSCRDGVCKPTIILDLEREPFGPSALNHAEGLRSALVAPLAAEGMIIGLLVVYGKNAPDGENTPEDKNAPEIRNVPGGKGTPGGKNAPDGKVVSRPFDPVDLELVQIFVNQAVQAIETAQAFQELKAARDELQHVLEIMSTIAHAATLEEGLAALANHLVTWIKVTFCHIFIYDEVEQTLTKKASVPIGRAQPLRWNPDAHMNVPLESFQAMRYLIDLDHPQVFKKGDLVGDQEILLHIQQMLSLPDPLNEALIITLKKDQKKLGVCTLGEMRERDESRFDEEKIYRAVTLAGQASVLIQRLQMQVATEKRAAREQQLRKAGERITQNTTLPLSDLTNQIAEMACAILIADCAVVYPYYAQLGVYDVRAIGSYRLIQPDKRFSAKIRGESGGSANYILKHQNQIVVDDVQKGWARDNLFQIHLDENKFLKRENVRAFVGLRLQIEQEPVGALFVNFREPHHFTEAELDVIEIFASQAAVALQQARLLQRGEKERRVNETMYRITQMIGVKISPKPILEQILRSALEITGKNRYGLILGLRPDGASFQVMLQIGYGEEAKEKTWRSPLFQAVLLEKTARLLLDTEEDPLARERRAGDSPIRSLLAAPFSSTGEGDPDSLLVLESLTPAAFTPDDRTALEALAAFAGIALQSTSRYAQIRENNRLQAGLLEASQKIAALEEPHKIVQNIVNSARAALRCDLVTLHTYDRELREINLNPITAGELYHPERLEASLDRLNSTIAGGLVRSGKSHFSNDTEQDAMVRTSKFVQNERIKSSGGIPLIVGHEPLGILYVNYRKPHFFSEQEKRVLRLFAGQAALALNNAKMYEKLEIKNRHLRKVHDASKLIVDSIGWRRERIMADILREAVMTITGVVGAKATVGTIQLVRDDALVFESVYPDPPSIELHLNLLQDESLPLDTGKTGSGRIGITGRACRSGKPQLVKDVYSDPDYHEFCAETLSELAVPMRDGGKVIGVLNVESNQLNAFDEDDEDALEALADLAVIALRNAERAEQLTRANAVAIMGAWGADVAHDINREVGNIRRAVKLLELQPDISGPVKEKISKIDSYAEAMRLPDLSPQAGDFDYGKDARENQRKQAVDEIIREALVFLRDQHQGVDLHFSRGCPGVTVMMDRQWIRRILLHLVANAARECLRKPGLMERPQIHICSMLHDRMVEIQVEDDGPGVPQDFVNDIFKKPLPSGGQSGRGLLLVQFLVEHHGGTVRMCWSRPGIGACFAFTLMRSEQ